MTGCCVLPWRRAYTHLCMVCLRRGRLRVRHAISSVIQRGRAIVVHTMVRGRRDENTHSAQGRAHKAAVSDGLRKRSQGTNAEGQQQPGKKIHLVQPFPANGGRLPVVLTHRPSPRQLSAMVWWRGCPSGCHRCPAGRSLDKAGEGNKPSAARGKEKKGKQAGCWLG